MAKTKSSADSNRRPPKPKPAATRLAMAACDQAMQSAVLSAFDPTIILTILNLLPNIAGLFTRCFGPKPTPAQVQGHLIEDYHANGNEYGRSVLRSATKQALKAAKKTKHRMNRHEAEAIATAWLDQARDASPDVMMEACAAK